MSSGAYRAGSFCVVAALGLAALGLGGCGSVSQQMSERMGELPAVGLPANAPARPATAAVYPAVLEMPPQRANTVLNDAEQQKMEDELVAARSRQQSAAGVTPAAAVGAKKKAAKASASNARAAPAPSNKSIY